MVSLKWVLLTSLISLATTTFSPPVAARPPSPTPSAPVSLDDLRLRYSPEFGLTGCSQLADPLALLCMGWLDEELTTCLQWGEHTAIAACFRRRTQGRPPIEFQHGNDVVPMPTDQGWGYRLNLNLP